MQVGSRVENRGSTVDRRPRDSGSSTLDPRSLPAVQRGRAARNYRRVGWVTRRAGRPIRKSLPGRRRKGKPYNFIKVRDDGPPQKRWVPLARYNWEQQHGPVPAGHVVVHRTADTLDDSLTNLILIERRQLLAHQRALDPGIAGRRRRGLKRASRDRWDCYYKLAATLDPRSLPAVQLGRWLRSRRQALGLTQHALGKLAELSGSYVGQVERGEFVLPSKRRVRLAAALRLTSQQGARLSELAARAEDSVCRRGTPEWRARISAANRGRRCNPAAEFKRGHRPWNKDLKGIRLSPATEFQPGCLRGRAARNYRRVGWVTRRAGRPIRKSLPGRRRKGKPYNFIKVRDDGPPQKRWVPLARYNWEQQHGPVPAGHVVVHRTADTLDDSLTNLILIERRQLLAHQRALDPGIAGRRRRGLKRGSRDRWDCYYKLAAHRRRVSA